MRETARSHGEPGKRVDLGDTERAVMAKEPTNDSKDEKDEVDRTPPGPVDHGRDGGMATREIAPEITEPDDD